MQPRARARALGRAGAAVLLVSAALACRSTPAGPVAPLPEGIAADVAFLASPTLAGRATGTPGSERAAAYIARHHERLGLAGAFPSKCVAEASCAPSLYQRFHVQGKIGRNVGVVVPGADSALRGEYVVVGAHYDHIGRAEWASDDPELGSAVRPGADDNASGTAAVLELARRLAARPPRRSVLLLHFDAEELGLVGSRVFVDNAPVARERMVLMVNLDMVGRLRDARLTVQAPVAPAHVRAAIDQAAAGAGLRVEYSTTLDGRSDHASFVHAHVPSVALFTGFHGDYHRATDIAARLDLRGLARVVDVAEAIVRTAGDRAADR
ncbi:M20/M25/M40 family metallo-hydrolase [Roseisolibacter agri]|uniref:Peptidase M28 domain-containing protein n=1 Tax=Roseisolibacter agri TaxID=2014610 RepID=A0AA37V0K5_9BACT|nr:M20/M25/M40 family metallo-hydrolase [Roseisolibacter agri]GLC24670.1 hypothetical protein rosag_11830 [Roseisolibacter agri]